MTTLIWESVLLERSYNSVQYIWGYPIWDLSFNPGSALMLMLHFCCSKYVTLILLAFWNHISYCQIHYQKIKGPLCELLVATIISTAEKQLLKYHFHIDSFLLEAENSLPDVKLYLQSNGVMTISEETVIGDYLRKLVSNLVSNSNEV